jgi:hypothetical protein
MRFLAPSGVGMVAEIVENRKNEFISIRRLAFVTNPGTNRRQTDAIRTKNTKPGATGSFWNP